MLSSFEKELIRLCYDYYKSTNSTEFTYLAKNSNDLVHVHNSLNSMEQYGYISNVIDKGFSFSFIIEDPLIHYMELKEF